MHTADTSLPPSSSEQIEPDHALDFDDEGFAESMSNSYVTSIASDIRRGIEEVNDLVFWRNVIR